MTSHRHRVTVVDHPLVQHKLTQLRRALTPPAAFRRLARDLAALLTYEATRDLPLADTEIDTPVTSMRAPMLAGPGLCLVSVLRAGNGFLDGALDLLPQARVGHIGLYRDEATLQAVEYYFKVPDNLDRHRTLLCDPMLATGGTAAAALTRLKEAGAKDLKLLCLVAAPEGLDQLAQRHPEVPVVTAAIDNHLDDKGYIVPGLGDAGDRLYGTL